MKKILLLMATHMVCLFMCAQSQLVVNATDGSQTKIALDRKPSVTFGLYGDKVKISYEGKTKEIDVKDLKFEGVKADSKEMIIINGEMFPLASIKSILQKSYEENATHLANLIAKNPDVSIYYAALKATHMDDSIKHYVDVTYTWASDVHRIDSCTWTNPMLCIPTAKDLNGAGGEYDNVAYPEKHYFNYTALLVPDAVLKEKYGINTLDDLRKKAHELYDPMYPEHKDITDETDRRNALNRFISYHLLPIYGGYYTLTAMDNNDLQYNFNRMKSDICDWYETLMPYSIIKFSFPSGPQVGLYINRRGVRHNPDDRGVFVRGAKVNTPREMIDISNTCFNGIYHYIDDIAAYDETTQTVVCYDRIRVDATNLSPDFMTQLTDGDIPRGHTWGNGEKYGNSYNTNNPLDNPSRCVGFKPGFARNFKYKENTHVHVRNRALYFWSYQGDEVILKGNYDATIKLPSLPAGQYELRLATCIGYATRGVVQMYINGVPMGDPVDFRPGGQNSLSPYAYFGEETRIGANRVIRYYRNDQTPIWINEYLLKEIQENTLIEGVDGWSISANWSDPVKEYYLEYGEEISDAELMERYKEEIIYKLFKENDRYLYRTAHNNWQQAQNSPDQVIFEGDEPLDPDSEEMNSYYTNLIDWTSFFKLGPVKYLDKVMHDQGWMRGAGDYSPGWRTAYDAGASTMRELYNTRRKVIGTFYTDGNMNNYLRLQQTLPGDVYEMAFDYIELVPVPMLESENIY